MISSIVQSQNSEIWAQSPKYNGSCDWLDNARICETSCENDLLKCLDECQTNGCTDQCKSDFYSCADACPCHTDCPLGCIDCENWACENDCDPPEENQDKIKVWRFKTSKTYLKVI